MKIKNTILILMVFLFSACSNQNSPKPIFQIDSKEEIPLYSIKDKNYKKVYQIVNAIKLDYKDSLKKIEYFDMPESEIPALYHNLIWTVGPNPLMSRDMFHVKKFADDTLMEQGYGIKEKVGFILKKIYNVKDPESEAKKMGFNNFKEMFNVVFERVSNQDTKTLIEHILKLKKKGLLNTTNIFVNVKGFKKKLNKFIIYANEEYFYYMYGDNTMNVNGIDVLNKSNFYVVNKFNEKIYFKSKDYEIYSFVLDLCYEFIQSQKRGKGIDVL